MIVSGDGFILVVFTLTESLTISRYLVIAMSEIAMEIRGGNKITYRVLASEKSSHKWNVRGRDRRRFLYLIIVSWHTYFNLLDSPELLQILVTLTAVIKLSLPNFLGRAIVILNFVRRFRNFIADTVPW